MIERDLIIVYQAQGFKDWIWPIMVSDTFIMDSGEDHQTRCIYRFIKMGLIWAQFKLH